MYTLVSDTAKENIVEQFRLAGTNEHINLADKVFTSTRDVLSLRLAISRLFFLAYPAVSSDLLNLPVREL